MDGLILAILGGVTAVFCCGIGSSIGIGLAGSAANGVLSEDPDKFGSMLLLVSLPGTQGIYGFLVGFLVIMKLGLLTATIPAVTMPQGLGIFCACLPIAISGMISAVHQGRVCAAGIGTAAKHPEAVMRAVIYAALVETYAVLGLVSTIFFLNGIKI